MNSVFLLLLLCRVDSPASQRGYGIGHSNYNSANLAVRRRRVYVRMHCMYVLPNPEPPYHQEYAKLQSELEREQRRRLAAEKAVRELTRRLRR